MKEQNTWLTKEQLAYLFGCDTKLIEQYLNEAMNEELTCNMVKQVLFNQTNIIEYYNTEALFSIGYRIHNKQGIKFRKWVSEELMKQHKK